jgi:hypothetical protein
MTAHSAITRNRGHRMADPSQAQPEVLRMSDPGVQAPEGDSLPGELVVIHLARAKDEYGAPGHEEDRTRYADDFQEHIGWGNHVGQKEGRKPTGHRTLGQ